MSYPLRALGLVLLWLLAWGDASVANLLSGLALAVVLLATFPPRRAGVSTLRPNAIGLVRLVLYVAGQLVTSNILVAREILAPRSRVRTGVLAYQVRHPHDAVIALIANVIGLTPGTMTVEATRDPAVVYVHFLLLDDIEAARRSIARLEDLVVGALGAQHVVARGPASPPAGDTDQPLPGGTT